MRITPVMATEDLVNSDDDAPLSLPLGGRDEGTVVGTVATTSEAPVAVVGTIADEEVEGTTASLSLWSETP